MSDIRIHEPEKRKRSPGPWHVGHSGISVYARDGANKVAMPAVDVPLEEKTGNALLIAAAPDLLAVLREARDYVKWTWEFIRGPDKESALGCLNRIDATIAKAEGSAE